MRDRSRASFTADAACGCRAHGALHPDPALRSPDHLAGRLVGMPFRALLWPVLRRAFIPIFERRAKGVYFAHQARTKHLDAVVLAELDAGAKQLVLLGAGFDSRAHRFQDKLAGSRVFEVDHPATSAEKRARVRRAFGEEPAHVTYVTVDFAREQLGERLAASGFDLDAKTLFLWEGVSVYLPASAVEAMLRLVASAGEGSSIVFDYLWRSALERPTPAMQKQLALAASYGEPYQFGIEPDQAAPWLSQNGLSLVSNVSAEELAQRYLVGQDGRRWGAPFPELGILHARVP